MAEKSVEKKWQQDAALTQAQEQPLQQVGQRIQARECQISQTELKRLLQEEAMSLPDMDIVMSGMAGRFPKANSVNEYEENLRFGRDMVNDQDEARFQCGLWGLPPRAGRLKDLSRFDYEFFGYSAEEANYIDYQLRILYEVVYESIVDAGVNPSSLRGTNTGVFFGFHCNEFENAMADDPAFKSNGYYGQFAVKVAQYFDLRGLTVTFDAACASSFVGLHNAAEALRDGTLENAIVCSSNIPIHPTGSFIFYQMQMLSPTGYSRFLDSRADGYVKSEACVSVLLQRKQLARRNYCSFLATMTSVDGYKQEGITFPSDKSQERLMRATKAQARLSTNHVEYLEAHGTGTPAGDPQEARAISNVYYPDDNDEQNNDQLERRLIGPLLVGSVKTNMGHSEAASGLCALVKVALMLENELIYKNLHYAKPNTNIKPLMDGRLVFVDEPKQLKAKIIPLSCYGFGGSNVHVIVRANEREQVDSGQQQSLVSCQQQAITVPRLVAMFGRSEQTLGHFFDQILDKDNHNTRNCLSEDFLMLVDSLNLDPIDRMMNYRGFMLIDRHTGAQIERSIKRCDLQQVDAATLIDDLGRRKHLQDCKQRDCHLLFAGLGSKPIEFKHTASQDLMQLPQFWSTIERLHETLFAFQDDINLFEMFKSGGLSKDDERLLRKCFVWIVAHQVALVNIIRDQLLVQRLGFTLGHSLGEIACAYATGVFSERDAIMVAYRLGQACDELGSLIEGRMVAIVGLSEQELTQTIGEYSSIRIACRNGPNSFTLSGRKEQIDRCCASLSSPNSVVLVQQVHSEVALHNELIMGQPEVRRKLTQMLELVLLPGTDYGRNLKRWRSSFEGGNEFKEANVDYFVEMLCRPVNLVKNLDEIKQESIILELGQGALLESLIAQRNRSATEAATLHYVKMVDYNVPDIRTGILKAIGKLYQAGANFDLSNFYQTSRTARRRTPSLGALISWQHESELFVPRYPVQFSKSSAKCELPIDLVQERDKFLVGHCVEGRILYPATGYLFLIWRVFSFTKRKIYDACFHDVERELVPIEFRNVRLMRAVILGNRVAQVYIQFEEATGRFEIKEGGSVVVEGYAFSPSEKPNGLLYDNVRERIAAEQLQCELNKDDVYKQFRVNGYDYGDTFQNITECSMDGRFCRVKFNGHFVALTDSILQSIFLAVADYAPTSGGLFLPTRFEYVRFQPEIILRKLHACNMALDLVDGSLNTKAKREMMDKIMQRESAKTSGGLIQEAAALPRDEQVALNEAAEHEANSKIDCFFETYCDPTLGVIVTDGIEMRGIKATPAPRRVDNISELLLESQQFVADFEEPVDDPNLTAFCKIQAPYVRVCDSLALELLMKLCGLSDLRPLNGLVNKGNFNGQQPATTGLLEASEIATYKARHLACVYDEAERAARKTDFCKQAETTNNEQEEYDIKKNGSRTLLSVLDQLVCWLKLNSNQIKGDKKLMLAATEIIRKSIHENRNYLMRDLIQESFTSERLIRPMIEQVLENVCMKKSKLRMVEINMDDGLVGQALEQLIGLIEPQITLDYALAHPDPSRLHGSQLDQKARTYTLRARNNECESVVQSLFSDNQLRQLDFIVFKDISCYSLPQRMVEENGLAPVVSSLGAALKAGGYCLLMMRRFLTLAERVLLALSEPELVGLSKQDVELVRRAAGKDEPKTRVAVAKINQINAIMERRCQMMLVEGERANLLCVGRKTDANGCMLMLFRRPTCSKQMLGENATQTNESTTLEECIEEQQADNNKLLLRVQHDQLDWLEELKSNFAIPQLAKQNEENSNLNDKHGENKQISEKEQSGQLSEPVETPKECKPKIVWLCAVSSRSSPISGLVGMMKALRRELGAEHLRCFHDEFTFAHQEEPPSIEQIERSQAFQMALKRDQVWFCVEPQRGQIGAFRHLTIDEQLSADECLCSRQPVEPGERKAIELAQQLKDAYVNNVTRGDLSSFAWHEAPFKHLDSSERKQLVQVAYGALNFRDIMLASGRLPLDAIPLRLAQSDCLLGLEFSGLSADNRRVMGMVYGRALATRVICPPQSSLVLEIPHWLKLSEAATIPVAYATAVMALIYRGRALPGESILVHAGSGGVGQAALHLCAHLKLKTYVSVGTQEKRDFLLAEFGHLLKPEHIFNSRDCSFESDLLRATKGRGVDLILNSLADDKLQASLNCLADGGRFLEIGKYDMSLDSRLELLKLNTNKTFHGILLDKLFDVDDVSESFKDQLRCVHETLRQGLQEGFIKPIRHKLFKRHQIEEAFRFMATGKHIGKVLVEIEPGLSEATLSSPNGETLGPPGRCLARFQLDKQKAYIVTGALGGFGLELCKWLVGSAGARHLVLTSRTGPRTGYQRAVLRRLESAGCRVRLVCSNEADAAASRRGARALCDIARQLAPNNQLGGLFHLAMVLRDSLLENMSRADFEQVCAPKLATCVNLDAETRQASERLDYFVAFSSITSGKGNSGQANYAYANSCVERVCERRRAAGHHALAIQWGAIGDVGVAFERLGGNNAVIGGTLPQRMPSCFATLAKLLGSPFVVCSSLLPLSRRQGGAGDKRGGGSDLVGAIMHVLGIKDPSKVSDDATLGELGLDSLMAVEIRQYIEREYDKTLNIQEIRSLTIAKIREINDTQRPTSGKNSAGAPACGGAPIEGAADTGNNAQVAASGAHMLESAQGNLVDGGQRRLEVAAMSNGGGSTRIDKSLVASFVPQLELPEADFVDLNGVRKADGCNPLFFLPPIHGHFKQLESLCDSLERHCVGVNWTRKLGSRQTMGEAVEVLYELLNSQELWQMNQEQTSAAIRVVDLVGYSFGATVAFELMLKIHERAKCNTNNSLQAGQLILLDGSPRQIELGSQFLFHLTSKKPLKLEEKVDELLMVYVISHTRGAEQTSALATQTTNNAIGVNYLELQTKLRQHSADLEAKVNFASEQLASVLRQTKRNARVQQKSIAHAMEAFCRKYELISKYKAISERKLPTGCTLIRAEKLYMTNGTGGLDNDAAQKTNGEYNRDLGLAQLVDGQLEVHIMEGDHESFLEKNQREICEIIERKCSK